VGVVSQPVSVPRRTLRKTGALAVSMPLSSLVGSRCVSRGSKLARSIAKIASKESAVGRKRAPPAAAAAAAAAGSSARDGDKRAKMQLRILGRVPSVKNYRKGRSFACAYTPRALTGSRRVALSDKAGRRNALDVTAEDLIDATAQEMAESLSAAPTAAPTAAPAAAPDVSSAAGESMTTDPLETARRSV